MLDHLFLRVRDLDGCRRFYERALAPLGYKFIREFDGGAGYGTGAKPTFWVMPGGPTSPPVHLAFAAPDRPTVDAFHAAALAAGGRENGAPGLRAAYHASYYGAFVLDPDGNNLEAVCHKPA